MIEERRYSNTDEKPSSVLDERNDELYKEFNRKDLLVSNFKLVKDEILKNQTSSVTDQIVRLVAVSKYQPSSDILTIYNETGHLNFGENYLSELEEKMSKLPKDIKWHFIGTLQTNKCKTLGSLPGLFAIETVDSMKKAQLIQRSRKQLSESFKDLKALEIYLQINTSNEPEKSGFKINQQEGFEKVYETSKFIIESCDWLELRGLMTIGSIDRSKSTNHLNLNSDFDRLVRVRDDLSTRLDGYRLGLSMGMSEDFGLAIRMGSDNVRVGSKIFGKRPVKS
ncbi:hypothetical protein BY996DRAFT_6436008 [Phakopsora pachyrhizi]|nr:hypothetical protein BY996DRAFT_6436008 [Phakopsora pachyrhizi]